MKVKPSQNIELEVVIDDRPYRLTVPVGAPLGDAYNATISMANTLVQMMQKDLNKRSNDESAKNEE